MSAVDLRFTPLPESAELVYVPGHDKTWKSGQADKGGFIQEVLGWNPPLAAFIARHGG